MTHKAHKTPDSLEKYPLCPRVCYALCGLCGYPETVVKKRRCRGKRAGRDKRQAPTTMNYKTMQGHFTP